MAENNQETPVVKTQSKTPLTDELKQRLLTEKAKLLAILAPARKDYEELVNHPRLLECKKIIREVSPLLAEIENELAVLARNRRGNRGLRIEPGTYQRGQ